MRVIARAYRDQPLDRVTVGHEGKIVFIANPSVADSVRHTLAEGVGFPAKCVFPFDQALFDSLRYAWETGDADALSALWERASCITGEALELA